MALRNQAFALASAPDATTPFLYNSRSNNIDLRTNDDLRFIEVLPQQWNGRIQVIMWRDNRSLQKYRCLSYTWGPEDSGYEILINGKLHRVRKNLHDFLATLTDSGRARCDDLPFWIDAMCIDQANDQEKALQVQGMGSTYMTAFEVVIWLGNEIDLQPLLFWEHATLEDELPAATKKSLDALITHPYWTRSWITQELLMASSTCMRAQMDQIRWEEILGTMLVGRYVAESLPARFAAARKGRKPQQERKPDMLWEILKWRGESACSDNRDRLFSLLALVGASHFPVSYAQDASQLFWRAAKFFKASRNFENLTLLRKTLGLECADLTRASGPKQPSASYGDPRISDTEDVYIPLGRQAFIPKLRLGQKWFRLGHTSTHTCCNTKLELQRGQDMFFCTRQSSETHSATHTANAKSKLFDAHIRLRRGKKDDRGNDLQTTVYVAPHVPVEVDQTSVARDDFGQHVNYARYDVWEEVRDAISRMQGSKTAGGPWMQETQWVLKVSTEGIVRCMEAYDKSVTPMEHL